MKSAVFAGALALAVVALSGLSHAQSESAPQAAETASLKKPKQTTIMYQDRTIKSGASTIIVSRIDSARNQRNKVVITRTKR